jgi:hypothetical protein
MCTQRAFLARSCRPFAIQAATLQRVAKVGLMTPARARRKASKLLQQVSRFAELAETEPFLRAAVLATRNRYLASVPAKAAVLCSLLPQLEQRPDALFAIAEQLNAISPRPQPIRWRFKERRSGSLRIVCNFPIAYRVSHRLALNVIRAQVIPPAHIFGWHGRGRDRAVEAVANALRTHGSHVLVADVRRCFEHVEMDAIYDLDLLPSELIRNALDYRSLTFRRYGEIPRQRNGLPYGREELERTGPRGLMEGSGPSDALIAVLFDDLPSHFSERLRLFVYGDNIVAVAASAEAISHAEQTLARYMAGHRAGSFFLRTEQTAAADGFEFLGYRIWAPSPGNVEVEQSDANWCKALRKLEEQAGDHVAFDPEMLAADVLQGFPALTTEYRELLCELAADELAYQEQRRSELRRV